MSKPETMKIDDVEYVRKDSILVSTPKTDGMDAVIVRTYSAGVFYGYLESRDKKTVVLNKARRMWRWYGASLSECAQSGTPNVSKCKFPEAVDKIILTEVIEILYLTTCALNSLDGVPIWKA